MKNAWTGDDVKGSKILANSLTNIPDKSGIWKIKLKPELLAEQDIQVELIRLLLNHPYAELAFALSRNAAGKRFIVFIRIFWVKQKWNSSELQAADILFLCLPHKEEPALVGEE
jgi:hypothetical protein